MKEWSTYGFIIRAYNGCEEDLLIKHEINGHILSIIGPYSFSPSDPKASPEIIEARKCIKKISIENGIGYIKDHAFCDCEDLNTVAFPDSLEEIGDYAFANTSIKEIVLPASLRSKSSYTFANCKKLKKIIVPEGVRELSYAMFADCTKLSQVSLPETLTSLAVRLFRQCKSLKEITIPKSVRVIGSGSFEGCTGLSVIAIPKNVTSIDAEAFSGCTKLQTVTFDGTSIESISDSAFNCCIALQNINLPYGVETLGTQLFSDCEHLESITIPSTVFEFHLNSLFGVESLKELTIKGKETELIDRLTYLNASGEQSFYNPPKDLVIIAPKGSHAEAYANAKGLTFKELPHSQSDTVKESTVHASDPSTKEIASANKAIIKWIDAPPKKPKFGDKQLNLLYDNYSNARCTEEMLEGLLDKLKAFELCCNKVYRPDGYITGNPWYHAAYYITEMTKNVDFPEKTRSIYDYVCRRLGVSCTNMAFMIQVARSCKEELKKIPYVSPADINYWKLYISTYEYYSSLPEVMAKNEHDYTLDEPKVTYYRNQPWDYTY